MNLQIQCPQCSKRFVVHEDLTGKTVECGACDHRFPVKSESIIVERAKFYPGEHKGEFLSRLGRESPLARKTSDPTLNRNDRAPTPQVDAIMPATPAQTIAAAAGICGMILYLLFFLVGTELRGPFQDLDMPKRFLLGGFVSLICGSLIIYGSKNWRGRGLMVTAILIAALMALIFIRPVHITPTTIIAETDKDPAAGAQDETNPDESVGDSDVLSAADRRVLDRSIALQAENPLLGENAPEDFVVGIYVPDLIESHYQFIEKYYLRKLALPKSEALLTYKRNSDRDRFIIISGMKLDLDRLAQISETLGEVEIFPEERVLKIITRDDLFSDLDADLRTKLENPGDPVFFASNLEELRNSIDFDRVTNAIKRLASIPPETALSYKPQIAGELIRILTEETEPEHLSEIGNALKIYAHGSQAAINKVHQMIPVWEGAGIPIQKSFVEYLIDNHDPGVAAIIDRLWAAAPVTWDEIYLSLGSSIEDRLIDHLKESPLALKRSAATLLSKIGTAKCLPALTALASSTDTDLRILVERALAAVKTRS